MSSLDDSIKKIALLAVLEPDEEARYRRLYRWFSKTFNVSLFEAEEYPIEYILLHYYEEYYQNMEEEEIQKQILELTETPEERKERELKEAEEDANFDKMIEEEQAKERQALEKNRKIIQRPDLFTKKIGTTQVAIDTSIPSVQPKTESLPEEVTVSYINMDEEEFINSLEDPMSKGKKK